MTTFSSRSAQKYASLALCIVLVISFAVIGTLTTTLSHADSINPNNQFYIVGDKIIDPNGHVFLPIGANIGTYDNFDWAGDANNESSAAQAWGWNTVRLNVECTTAESYSLVTPANGDKVLLSEIDSVVQEYTAKHIVVMVECHDATLNANDAANFWTDMANKYKTNPYVWFNYANEPEWNDNSQWVSEQEQWLKLVRATGAENVFVADVMNAGNDAGWDGAKQVFDPTMGPSVAAGQCNILFSLHNYGGQANSYPPDNILDPSVYKSYFQNVQNANLAMIVGEFGMQSGTSLQTLANGSVQVVNPDPSDYYSHEPNGEYATIHYANSYGIGMLAWHSTFADGFLLAQPNSLNNNLPNFYNILNAAKTGLATGESFTQEGSDLWNAGHNQPNLGTFSGSYTSSNCASAQTTPTPTPTPPVVLQPIGSTPVTPAPPIVRTADQYAQTQTYTPKTTAATVSAAPAAAKVTSTQSVAPLATASGQTPPSTTPTVKTLKPIIVAKNVPKTIFSFSGRPVNARTVGTLGGGVSACLLGALLLFFAADARRSKKLYAQHHYVSQAMPSRDDSSSKQEATMQQAGTLTTSSNPLPGTTITPDKPRHL
jgi:mannan endo-1,4-beta-mannosidase